MLRFDLGHYEKRLFIIYQMCQTIYYIDGYLQALV